MVIVGGWWWSKLRVIVLLCWLLLLMMLSVGVERLILLLEALVNHAERFLVVLCNAAHIEVLLSHANRARRMLEIRTTRLLLLLLLFWLV